MRGFEALPAVFFNVRLSVNYASCCTYKSLELQDEGLAVPLRLKLEGSSSIANLHSSSESATATTALAHLYGNGDACRETKSFLPSTQLRTAVTGTHRTVWISCRLDNCHKRRWSFTATAGDSNPSSSPSDSPADPMLGEWRPTPSSLRTAVSGAERLLGYFSFQRRKTKSPFPRLSCERRRRDMTVTAEHNPGFYVSDFSQTTQTII